ncbi:50S ribosomal protein L17 [Patescibacteria group bacterium]
MRHRVAGKKLSRHRSHRKSLFKGLISSLVIYGEVKTTESKAKAVRPLVEKLITKGKPGTLHARRLIAAFLQDKKVVNKIVDELSPLFKDRPGGYTRIIRIGRRQGDDAMMVKLELVEKPVSSKKTSPKNEKIVKKQIKSKTLSSKTQRRKIISKPKLSKLKKS